MTRNISTLGYYLKLQLLLCNSSNTGNPWQKDENSNVLQYEKNHFNNFPYVLSFVDGSTRQGLFPL